MKLDESKLYYILKRLIQFHSWLLIFHNSEIGTAFWTAWNGRAPPSCHPILVFSRGPQRETEPAPDMFMSWQHAVVPLVRSSPISPAPTPPADQVPRDPTRLSSEFNTWAPPPTPTPTTPQPGPLSPLPCPLALSSLTWGGCGVTGSHSSTHSLFVSSYCINGRRPNYLALSFMTRDPQCPLCQIAMGDWKEKRKKKNQARKWQGNNKSRLESGKLRKAGSRCAQDASSVTSQQNIIRWFVVVAVVLFCV